MHLCFEIFLALNHSLTRYKYLTQLSSIILTKQERAYVHLCSHLLLSFFLTGNSACSKIFTNPHCSANSTVRLCESNICNEVAQGINGKVPVKHSPRPASNPKPQGQLQLSSVCDSEPREPSHQLLQSIMLYFAAEINLYE